MGITIDKTTHGVELVRYAAKKQQIFIPTKNWLKLIQHKDDIDEAMSKKEKKTWTLGAEDLLVGTSLCKDDIYLSIRFYYEGRPTKQGVTMPIHDWTQVANSCTMDEETKMGLSVFESMLKTRVGLWIKKQLSWMRERLAFPSGSSMHHGNRIKGNSCNLQGI